MKEWSREDKSLEREGLHQIEFYFVYVGFKALPDEEERSYFSKIPTALALPKEDVDNLIEVAGRIIYQAKDFQRLVQDLGGTIPVSDSQDAPNE
jgi:hypothetical protein